MRRLAHLNRIQMSVKLAARLGVEPRNPEPKSGVLPLHYQAIYLKCTHRKDLTVRAGKNVFDAQGLSFRSRDGKHRRATAGK